MRDRFQLAHRCWPSPAAQQRITVCSTDSTSTLILCVSTCMSVYVFTTAWSRNSWSDPIRLDETQLIPFLALSFLSTSLSFSFPFFVRILLYIVSMSSLHFLLWEKWKLSPRFLFVLRKCSYRTSTTSKSRRLLCVEAHHRPLTRWKITHSLLKFIIESQYQWVEWVEYPRLFLKSLMSP